jgi:ribonuclease T1
MRGLLAVLAARLLNGCALHGPALLCAALFLCGALLQASWAQPPSATPAAAVAPPAAAPALLARGESPRAEPGAGSKEIAVAALPPEARTTLKLIRAGGPFPFERDGIVFGNRERLLPQRARGYYREYTVKTPGERTRGARRIVAGEGGELYYTDDHYASFRRIRE